MPSAHRLTPADAKEADEIAALAPQLYLIDVRLGRVTGPGWHAQSDTVQQTYLDRAALAVRIGNPAALLVAVYDAAAATRKRHPFLVRDMVVAQPIANTALATFISAISRH